MTDRHVLITGGAGYIGSLLTSELLRANYRVTVLDSLLFGGESLVPFLHHPNFHFVKADVTESRAIKDSLKDGSRVVTQVLPLENFYKAEEYHQNYFKTNTSAPYCQLIIEPKIEKVRKRFAELVQQ